MRMDDERMDSSDNGSDAKRGVGTQAGKTEAGDAGYSVIESANLLRGRNQVWIAHGSERYSLRQTRTGKLILTK